VVNSIAHYERETKGHAEDLEIAKSERDELMKQWRGVGGPSTEPTRKNALAARRSLEQTITNVENSRTARVNEIQDLEAKLKQAQVALERARRLARIAELDRAEIEKRLKEVQPQIEALSAEARRLKDDRQSIRQQIAAEMNRLELQVLEPGDGDKPPVPKPPQREDAIVLPPAQFHQRRRELEEQYRQAYEKSARETEIELELAALAKEKSRLEDRLQTLLTADPPNENEDIERLRRELAIARVELESAQRNALTKLRTVKNKAARIRRKHAEMTGASSKMAGPLVTIATTLLTIKAPLPVTAGTQSHFDALDAVLKVDIRPRLDQLQSGVEKYNSKTGATDENSPAMRDTKFIHLLGEVDGFIRSGRQLDSALRGVETAQKKVADLESRIANRDD
jgi:chromosome segregation ATPase